MVERIGKFVGGGPPPVAATIQSLGANHWYKHGGLSDVQLNCASVLNSTAFTRWTWSRTNIGSVIANQANDPDGGTRADLVEDDTTNAVHTLTSTIDNVSTVSCTAKVWAKAGTANWVYLSLNGGSHKAWFNLSTGALGTVSGSGAVGRITAASGGYWCELDCTYASGSLVIGIASADNTTSYAGSGSNLYLYGGTVVQQRVGRWFDRIGGNAYDFTAASIAEEFLWLATSANLNSKPGMRGFGGARRMTAGVGSNFEFLHDGTGGTLVVVINDNGSTSTRIINTADFGGTLKGIYLRSTTTTAWDYFIGNGSVNVRTATKSGTPKGLQCVVASWKSTSSPDAYVRANGVVGTVSGSGTLATGAAVHGLQIGSTASSTNGDLAEIITFPKELSAAELASLSVIMTADFGLAA